MKRAFPFPTEDVFFRTATEHYSRAMHQAGKVRRYSAPRCYVSFHGFPTDEGLGFAIAALVGWATSIEACTNNLYNKHVKGGLPPRLMHKRGSQNISTVSKLRKLLQVAAIAPRYMSWWPEIAKLFQIRKELVQHCEPRHAGDFRHAPVLRLKLTEQLLTNTWTAAMLAIDQLNALFHDPAQGMVIQMKGFSSKLKFQAGEGDKFPVHALQPKEDDIPY